MSPAAEPERSCPPPIAMSGLSGVEGAEERPPAAVAYRTAPDPPASTAHTLPGARVAAERTPELEARTPEREEYIPEREAPAHGLAERLAASPSGPSPSRIADNLSLRAAPQLHTLGKST